VVWVVPQRSIFGGVERGLIPRTAGGARFEAERLGEVRSSVSTSPRAKRDLGRRAEVSMRDGLGWILTGLLSERLGQAGGRSGGDNGNRRGPDH
jgi:hypothetical protein